MTANKQIGTGIILLTAIAAATGVVVGFVSVTPAVGVAVVGILIGTAVARGTLLAKLKGSNRN